MTAEGTFTPQSDIDRIFGPVVQPQTYRNLIFALLSFPLGLAYFVSIIVGLSVGFGTAILVIGLVILALTFALTRVFGSLERELAKALLGATFEPRPPLPRSFRAMFTDRTTWTMVIYLIIRFPVGIAGFVASILMLVSIPAMVAPLVYNVLPYSIGYEHVTNSEEALLISLFGCVLFLLAAHLVNGVAAIARRLAMALL